jgi:predicted chitinase
MVATQQTNKIPMNDAVVRPSSLWFAGTGPLGMTLNLGINTAYISKPKNGGGNQDKVNGKDVILGIIPDKNKDSELGDVPDKVAYKSQKWDLANAQYLAGLLLNPNIDNDYNPDTNKFGSNLNNSSGANQQDQALLDFLSVYSATQKGENGGGWNNIKIVNSDANTIRTALFGDGSQAGSVINKNQVLIGGASASLGEAMTAESLARIMEVTNIAAVAPWVEPLKNAMKAFSINTPQRIAAFLAQVRQESGSLSKKPSDLLELYSYPNSGKSAAYPLGRTTAEKISANFSAAFPTLASAESWVADNLPDFVAQYDSAGIVIKSRGFTEAEGQILFNYAYSGSNSKGRELGNDPNKANDGWDFRGHGLIQLTGRGGFQAFANYVDGLHLADLPSGAAIMAEPDLVATNIYLDVMSAAWYWSTHNALDPKTLNPTTGKKYYPIVGPLNNVALQSAWANPMPIPDENVDFNRISRGIGLHKDSYPARWQNYKTIAQRALANGNPYENISVALTRLGMQVSHAANYQQQFGISLAKRTPVPITISPAAHLLANTTASSLAVAEDNSSIQISDTAHLSAELLALVEQARTDLNPPCVRIVVASNFKKK